jgi:tRNA threonylcarbamoyladenosine modification (KEOPS) complex  Pcc1 subunit
MGTRNLTVVKNTDQETKIALYGQWDGYPSYSGIRALEFLRQKINRHNLLASLPLVEFISEEESEAIWETFDHDDNDPTKAQIAMPGLTRDTGITILEIVATASNPIKMIDNSEFRNDTLFCEGVYEVDFSTNKFITTYNDKVVEYDLDTLPTDEEYLAQWEVAPATANA